MTKRDDLSRPIRQNGIRETAGHRSHALKDFVAHGCFIGHYGCRQRCAPRVLQIAYLRDRHVESGPHAILEASDHLPSILERTRSGDLQDQSLYADKHWKPERMACTIGMRAGGGLQSRRNFLNFVALDDVAFLEVVVTLKRQTALHALLDFARILLEAL
jgi:hypothetical protein